MAFLLRAWIMDKTLHYNHLWCRKQAANLFGKTHESTKKLKNDRLQANADSFYGERHRSFFFRDGKTKIQELSKFMLYSKFLSKYYAIYKNHLLRPSNSCPLFFLSAGWRFLPFRLTQQSVQQTGHPVTLQTNINNLDQN